MPLFHEDISWVLAYRNEALTAFFKSFRLLTTDSFLMGIIAVGYWCLNRRFFKNVAVVTVVSTLLNILLKDIFQTPRPPIEHLLPIEAHSFSFPSGDVQTTTTLWLLLSFYYRKAALYGLSAALIVGVCLSRIYLGMHFVTDVVGGLILGASVVGLYFWGSRKGWYRGWDSSKGVAVGTILLIGYLAYLHAYWNPTLLCSAGFIAGILLDQCVSNSSPLKTEPLYPLQTGTIGIFALFVSLKLIKNYYLIKDPYYSLRVFTAYAFLSFLILYGVPFLTQMLNRQRSIR